MKGRAHFWAATSKTCVADDSGTQARSAQRPLDSGAPREPSGRAPFGLDEKSGFLSIQKSDAGLTQRSDADAAATRASQASGDRSDDLGQARADLFRELASLARSLRAI